MNKLPLIAGGALAACLAGYFGLSSYSSAQAEKRLEDWVYEHQLDDKLSWSKVSASPFGGSLSIHDLTFDVGGKEPLLRAAELHISEVISDEQRSRMRLRLQGIEADQQAMGGLRQLGQMGGFNRQLNQATRFAPAVNTGYGKCRRSTWRCSSILMTTTAAWSASWNWSCPSCSAPACTTS